MLGQIGKIVVKIVRIRNFRLFPELKDPLYYSLLTELTELSWRESNESEQQWKNEIPKRMREERKSKMAKLFFF